MGQFTSTKAQAWYLDFVLALAIFGVVFVMYLNTTSDILDREKNEFQFIVNDAERISATLLTSGYPQDWDNDTVQIIGIAKNSRVNSTLLLRAFNISYDTSRTLFATKNEYFVFLRNYDGNVINTEGVCGLGKNTGSTPISEELCSNFTVDSEKLVKIERLAIYNSDIVSMVTYLWE